MSIFLSSPAAIQTVVTQVNKTSLFISPRLLEHSKPQQPHFLSLNSLSKLCISFKSPYSSDFAPATDQYEDDEDDDYDDGDDIAADEYFEDDDNEQGQLSEDDNEAASFSGDDTAAFSADEKWERVDKLCKEVRAFGDGIIDVDELASVYDFRVDTFQRLSIQAFLRGSSVVVSAPTSSGKTLIAEAAAVATVARGKRLFYTTPLKALSNQKFREFRETFGESHVGLLTGDSSVNKDAQVLIMTTEILRNMLYQSVGNASGSRLSHVDAIVLDEVHYLSDISRGTVWEEIIIYCPKEVQLICLSATVANPDELAGWIDQIHGKTELVTSAERPVPLTWHFSTKYSLLPLLDEKGTRMNRKLSLNYLQLQASGSKSYGDDRHKRRNSRRRGRDNYRDSNSTNSVLSKNDINTIRRSQVPQIIDTLYQIEEKDMLPAIWFIFSRRGCDAAVQYLTGCQLLDDCEMSEVELALKRFRVKYPDAVREMAVKGLLRGAAAHHAGCLPLWKSFVEELFQRGLVKVVFATETLAAGINMPARTAVIGSLTKMTDMGRGLIRSNGLLQMAGRAGRRGIDKRGHVVLIQSPYEGAEECCKLLFAGVEPLVSQFTASYGMVLNLLAGARVRRTLKETDANKSFQMGRTMEEAKKLIEQSFGNYVSNNVMLAAKEELAKIEKDIKTLTLETSDDAIDSKARKLLSEKEYKEIVDLQEELRAEKRLRAELRRKMETERISALKPLLKESLLEQFPFMCLQYKDADGSEHLVSAVYLGDINSVDGLKVKDVTSADGPFSLETESQFDSQDLHVALGSDNSWYLFSEKWIRTVYKIGFPNPSSAQGNASPRDIMQKLLDRREMQWEKLADSEFGGFWIMEGSLETWSWSLNVPVPSSLSESDELLHMSDAYHSSVECYKEQRNKVARLKKRIARTEGFKEYKNIMDSSKLIVEKIKRLEARSSRLTNRIQQIEPAGWKEFLKISKAIHESRALDINTHVLFPLGETAAAIRGENELWLAMVIRSKALLELKPAQLAGVCASLVSEGIKLRPSKTNSYIFEPSSAVFNVVDALEAQRISLLQLQEKHGINISCYLDSQFSGMVEAWASGLTWKEMMMDCAMDEGDLARLLRRTIDLLAQIPKLPDIDPVLQRNAMEANNVMDRPPISELAG